MYIKLPSEATIHLGGGVFSASALSEFIAHNEINIYTLATALLFFAMQGAKYALKLYLERVHAKKMTKINSEKIKEYAKANNKNATR